jgi:hypothetical protein
VRVGTVVALVGFLVVATFGRVWTVFDEGPFSADFYDEQAHSLVHGRLDVDSGVAGIEGFRHSGKTYFYFGIVPAILHMPIAAVTHRLDGRLVIVSMLAALAIGLLAAGRLLWRARQWWKPDAPLGRRDAFGAGAFVAAVGLSSPLLFLSARALVYHEAIAWGVALTLLTFDLTLEWWERPTPRALAFASLAAATALNSRSSVGLGAAAGLGLIVLFRLPRMARRHLVGGAFAVMVPFILYSSVNVARFGDPIKIPWYAQGINSFDPHRVEMLNRNNGTTLGPQFVPTTFVDYLRPDGLRIQRLFPFITYRNTTRVFGDIEFDVIDRSSSVPTEAPLFCVLGMAGVIAMVRRRRRALPWALLTAAGIVGVGPTLLVGFTANRYLADFVPVLVMTGAIGFWPITDALRRASRALRRVEAGALVALTVCGVLIVGALTIQSERIYLLASPSDRLEFVRLQYDIDNDLFGGKPPAVESGPTLPTEVGDQVVFIVDHCAALYAGDGHNWALIEPSGPELDTSLCNQLLRRLDSNS